MTIFNFLYCKTIVNTEIRTNLFEEETGNENEKLKGKKTIMVNGTKEKSGTENEVEEKIGL